MDKIEVEILEVFFPVCYVQYNSNNLIFNNLIYIILIITMPYEIHFIVILFILYRNMKLYITFKECWFLFISWCREESGSSTEDDEENFREIILMIEFFFFENIFIFYFCILRKQFGLHWLFNRWRKFITRILKMVKKVFAK